MSLYEELYKTENLTIGWHLTRRGLKDNFIKDPFVASIWACNLQNKLIEIKRKLKNEQYHFSELLSIEVPKVGISSRPGTTMYIEDAIVLNTLIYLIIEKLNKKLPSCVYSYRLKDNWKNLVTKKQKSIYVEASAEEIPFLKKSTIYKRYISYEDWYVSWIEFDKNTQILIKDKSYQFLGVSDIAAYFENIQLPILKALILEDFPNERKIINFLFEALQFWTLKTSEGEQINRGLPQGGTIFSCLGNIFLYPIDKYFTGMKEDIKYLRYMDDIKIFAKDKFTIQKQLIRLGQRVRRLHLTIQTGKTKIFDENLKEISNEFLDARMDKLSTLDKEIGNYDDITKNKKRQYSEKLETILIGSNSKRFNSFKVLSPLELRVFQRYVSISCGVGNIKCINKFFRQMQCNINLKLLNKLPLICRSFASHYVLLEKHILSLVKNQNLFHYQNARYLESLRLLHSLSKETYDLVWNMMLDTKQHFYVRMQAIYLLLSAPLSEQQQKELLNSFFKEEHPEVRHALVFLLIKFHNSNEIINHIRSSSDRYISMVGDLLIALRDDKSYVKKSLSNFIKTDNIKLYNSVLYIIATSNNSDIKKILKEQLKKCDYKNIYPISLRKDIKMLEKNISY